MRFLNINVLQLAFFLIVGILIAHYFEIDLKRLLIVYSVFITILGIFYWIYRTSSRYHFLFQVMFFITVITIGVGSYSFTDDRNEKYHYTKFNNDDFEYEIQFRITKRLKPSKYATKYKAEILNINQKPAKGRILINIEKDALNSKIEIGTIFHSKGKLQNISPSKNPHQFDYQTYLANQQIYSQLFLNKNELLKIGYETTIYSKVQKIKQHISNKLESSSLSDQSVQIIKALILGERQDFEKTTYDSFINAGVVHILAISGLHFGLIYLFLNWLFSPVRRLKYGVYFSVGLILILLWSFAFFAGFSASVTRAVSMFSIVALATLLQRQKHILNTLLISAFTILLFYPRFLFDVGFQLSYCAVIGIVLFQPLFFKWINFKHKILKFFWGVLTVSVAAQMGVLPISLYYFHQFPGLFFMANLVAIPALIFILSTSFILIILMLFGAEIIILNKTFNFIIDLLTQYISWLASFKDFIFNGIEINSLQVLLLYLIIFSSYPILKTKNKTAVFELLTVIIGFQISLLYKNQLNNDSEFIVFHQSKTSMIGIKKQHNLYLNQQIENTELKQNIVLKDYQRGERIKTLKWFDYQQIFEFKRQHILIVDSLGVYDIKGLKPDIIILSNSPKINLDRVIDKIEPQEIVADGSNYKSYVERWEKTCKNKNIPFHSTYKKGCYRIRD